MGERAGRAVAMVLILAHAAAAAPAYQFDQARDAGRARLERGLQRAGKEADGTRWEEISRAGLEEALAEWESRTLYMKEGGGEAWENERESVAGEYALLVEKGYAEWLAGKFFEEAEDGRGALRAELEEAARKWEYGGSRRIGADDVQAAAAAWEGQVSGGLVEAYLAAWDARTEAGRQEIVSRLAGRGLSAEALGGAVDGAGAAYREYARAEYERIAAAEENALLRALLYDSASLQKLSEEEAARAIADRLASEAREQTGSEADELFGKLTAVIEGGAENGAELSGTDGWLAEFRVTFETGMRQWESAEGAFLAARSEWEADAAGTYAGGEQAWADAYGRLQDGRRVWEREIQRRLDEGIRAWEKESGALAVMLAGAAKDFQAAVNSERARVEQNIDMQAVLYTQSREMAEMALEGLNYWYERWGPEYHEVYLERKTGPPDEPEGIACSGEELPEKQYRATAANTDTDKLRKQMLEWKTLYIDSVKDRYRKELLDETSRLATEMDRRVSVPEYDQQSGSFGYVWVYEYAHGESERAKYQLEINQLNEELERAGRGVSEIDVLSAGLGWTELENRARSLLADNAGKAGFTSTGKGAEALFRAAREFEDWLSMLDRYKEAADGAIAELYRLGGGVLDAEGVWEYHDELGIELLKARAVSAYWERETAIAREVEDYARNGSSGKESGDGTLALLEEARKGYEAAAGAYGDLVDGLGRAYGRVTESKEAVTEIRENLAGLKADVEERRREYSAALLAAKNVSGEAVKGKIAEMLLSLGMAWTEESGEAEVREGDETETPAAPAYRMAGGADEGYKAALLEYNRAALRYAEAEAQAETNGTAARLINGNPPETKPLAALRDLVKAAEERAGREGAALYNGLGGMPEEYSWMAVLLGDRYDGARTDPEKKQAEAAIRDGWLVIARAAANEIEKREAAVRYILQGGTGLAVPDAAARSDTELETWLEVETELVERRLEAGDAGTELSEMKGLLDLLAGLEDTGAKRAYLKEHREEAAAGKIGRMESAGEETDGWAAMLYEAGLAGKGAYYADWEREITEGYGAYAYGERLARDLKAREALAGYLDGVSVETAIAGEDTQGYYDFITGLRTAAAGLGSGGQEALETYISGVTEYAALVYTRGNADAGESGALIEALRAAYAEQAETAAWEQSVMTAGGLLDIMAGSRYRAFAPEMRAAVAEAAAYALAGELPARDMAGCATEEDIVRLLSGAGFDAYGAIDADGRAAVAEKILALFGKMTEEEAYFAGIWQKIEGQGAGYDWKSAGQDELYVYLRSMAGYGDADALGAVRDGEEKAAIERLWLLQEAVDGYDKGRGIAEYAESAGDTGNLDREELKAVLESGSLVAPGMMAEAVAVELLGTGYEWENAGQDELCLYLRSMAGYGDADALGAVRDDEEKAAIERLWLLQKIIDGYDKGRGIAEYIESVKDIGDSDKEKLKTALEDGLPTVSGMMAEAEADEILGEDFDWERAIQDEIYCYLLGFLGEWDDAALDALSGDERREEVTRFRRLQDAASGYLPLLDGAAGEYANGLGLDAEERELVRRLLESGQAAFSNGVTRQTVIKAMKPDTGGTGTALYNGRKRTQDAALAFVREYLSRAAENTLLLQSKAALALAMEEEAGTDSAAWLDGAAALDYAAGGVLKRFGAEERDIINAMLEGGLDAYGTVKKYLLARIGETARYFTEREGEEGREELPEFAFALLTDEETEGILAAGEYKGEGKDTGIVLDALDGARAAYNAAAGGWKGVAAAIRAHLETAALLSEGKEAREERVNTAKAALDRAEGGLAEGRKEYDRAVAALDSASVAYNAVLDAADAAYEAAEAAKTELRKKQAVYEWARSVYLEGFGKNADAGYASPKEKLAEAEYAYLRARVAAEVLENMSAGYEGAKYRGGRDAEYEAAFGQYAGDYEKRYTAAVAAYETAREIARMEDIVRQAEAAERKALAALVNDDIGKNFDYAGNASLGLVHLALKEDGTYEVSLSHAVEYRTETYTVNVYDSEGALIGTAEQETTVLHVSELAGYGAGGEHDDNALLEKYFTEEAEPFRLVDSPGNKKTAAAAEALEWLQGVAGKGNYLDELGLASLWYRMAAGNYGKGWDGAGLPGDPRDERAWDLAGLPDQNMHGINPQSRYDSARIDQLEAAYGRVTGSAEGRADLAKYLLYRDTSLAELGLAGRERAELARRAAYEAAADVGEKAEGDNTAGVVLAATAAGLTAAGYAALATIIGSGVAAGLFIAAGVAAVAAAAFFVMARDLNDIKEQIRDFAAGNGAAHDAAAAEKADALADWKAKRLYLEEKWKTLDTYYGKPPEGETGLKYEDFEKSLGLILENAKGGVSRAEAGACFSEGIFLAARADEADGTMAAVKAVVRYLEKSEAESRVKLEGERALALMEKQDGDNAAFQARLAELMEIPEADKAKLRELALKAGDTALAAGERRKAEEEYDALAATMTGADAEEAVRAELAALAETALGGASWFMREHDRRLLELAEDIRNAGRTDYTRVTEDYTLEELARVKGLVLAAAADAAAGRRELKQTEWSLAQKAFYARYADWAAQINTVLGKSAAEWRKAEETLNAGYNEWRRNFEKTYAERTGEWLESYEAFLEDKDAWMREQYLYAANYADYGVMAQSGMNAGAAIAASLKNMENTVKPLEEQGFDTGQYVEKLIGDSNIAALMAFTGDLNGKAAGAAGVIRRGTVLAAGSASDYAKAEAAVAEIGAERRVTAARLAAEEARKQLAEARKSYAERLAAENRGMRDWEIAMARQAGYTADGRIRRTVVTDSLLFENKHETQTVHVYEDFVTAEAVTPTGLDDETLEGLDDYGVMAVLAQAQRELADWGEKIFGRVDDKGGQVQIRIARNGAAAARDAEKDEKENRDTALRRDGKLGEHIGYAPVFKEGDDLDLKESRSSNVRYDGAGEMGKIMLDFEWNNMMRGKGYGEMAQPVWDKRMWDDDGSWLQAPTLRSVTDMAVSAAVGVATGGLGALVANAAMGLADDAVFALLDGAMGYKGWDEVGVEFGKKVLTTAATTGLNIGFGGMNSAIGSMSAGIEKTIAGVAGGFVQGTFTNLAVSAVNSVTYTDGGFGFDTEGFGKSVKAGMVSSLVQGVQTAASGLINIGIEGLIGNALGDTSKMSNFIGGLAGQGVNAALGGDFTLNVLNLGFLAGDGNTALDRILSTGLLEMHLGGEKGFGMNIGTGGVDASIGNLMAVGRGIGTYIDVNSRLANTQQEATKEFASQMRTWYSGTEEERQSFDDALTNRLLLVKGTEKNFADENDPSKTAYAQTKDNGDGTRTMTIGTAALGLDSRFGLNVVFAHEAYRDGIDNGEEGQRAETDRAVEGHVDTALALMAGYGAGSVGDMFAFEATVYDYARTNNNTDVMGRIQEQYNSKADYWELTNGGKLINDGFARVVDENGKVIISLADLGMGEEQWADDITSLARMFGVSNQKAIEIMKVNPEGIQLGAGKGIGGNDYADALRYALTAEGARNVTGMADSIFNGMTTDERADYLKRQYIIGSTFIGEDKGTVAAQLRNLDGLHDGDIAGDLFYSGFSTPSKNISVPYYLNLADTYDFMNEPLRDFLNLNFDGSSQYESMSEILTQGFSEMTYPGNLYHLDSNYTDVRKYTQKADGREVIWGVNRNTGKSEQINSDLYRGTYNYGEASGVNIFGIGAHYYLDMRPFDVQHGYSPITPLYIEKAYRDANAGRKAK